MEPKVTVKSVSNYKISDEKGMDRSLITFQFDQPVQAFTVNVIGVSPDTGIVAEFGSKYVSDLAKSTVQQTKAKTISEVREFTGDLVAEVDWTECYQEGNNRVNIYGKGMDGLWTPYNQT